MSALDIVRKSHYGYYFIIIAAALAALVHVFSKPMVEAGTSQVEINPIVMAFLVYFICGIFFTPLVKKSPRISKMGKRDMMFMAMIGIAECAALITYFYGISTSTAVNASIFSNSEIIFALVIAMLVFKERLHIKECIPFSMIIIGMMIIPLGNDLYQNNFNFGNIVTGDLLIIFSGLLYAIDITLCKYLSDRFDVKKTVQIVSFICAAITISIIALFQIPMDIELAQVPNILVMSIAGTGMSTLFFLMGLKMIGAVRTVLLYSTTSIFGIIFSGIILSEIITHANIISVVLVLSGIFLLRNRLAETENIVPKHKTSNSNTNHVSFTKKRKVSIVSKWIHNKVAEKVSHVFPNSGIG